MWLARILVAQKPFEHVEPIGPEALIEAQPFIGAGQRAGIEPAIMGATAHVAPNQPRIFQSLDMLGGRGERYREGLGQLADGAFATGKIAQHPPPSRIAQRMENIIEARFI